MVFVLDLHPDDRAAVAPVEAVRLRADRVEERGHLLEVDGVILAFFSGDHPVGKPAVAHLGVDPWPYAHPDRHPVLLAEFQETPEVALAAPVEFPLLLLVEDPDDVGGDDVDPAGLHLQELGLPLGRGIPGVLELAHDRKPGLPVLREIFAVDPEAVPVGSRPAGRE